jgi:DNA repair protein RadA/Sms
LLGELRAVSGLDRRLAEAVRLGFRRAIVPRDARRGAASAAGLEVVLAASLREAVGLALTSGGAAAGTGDGGDAAGGSHDRRTAASGPAMLG